MDLRDQGEKLFPTPCLVTAQPAATWEPRILRPSQLTLCSLGPVVLLGPRPCRISGGWVFCPLAVPTQAGLGSFPLLRPSPQRSPGHRAFNGLSASPSLSRPSPLPLNRWDPDRHRHSQPQAPRQSCPGPPGTSDLCCRLPA